MVELKYCDVRAIFGSKSIVHNKRNIISELYSKHLGILTIAVVTVSPLSISSHGSLYFGAAL